MTWAVGSARSSPTRSGRPVAGVCYALAGLVHLRLIGSGQATPDIAWSGQPGLALPEAWEAGMDDALDAATADTPDATPLRALLAAGACV